MEDSRRRESSETEGGNKDRQRKSRITDDRKRKRGEAEKIKRKTTTNIQ